MDSLIASLTGYWSLIAAILLARGCASALRGLGASLPLRLLAGLFIGLAGWFASAFFMGWVPLWAALVGGIAVGVVHALLPRTPGLSWMVELIFILLLSVASLTPVPIFPLLLVAITLAGIGWIGDRLARSVPRIVQGGAAAAALFVGIQGAHVSGPLLDELWRADPLFPLYCAISRPYAGELVRLPTGAAAWHLPAKNRAQAPAAAVIFHGANPEGSRQPTAIALQRALQALDVEVLSIDHPGYGSSPSPPASAGLEDWNRLPSLLAALNYVHEAMRETDGPDRTIAVGHSMGVTDAMTLAASGAPIDMLYLLGGAIRDDSGRGQYWYERFHADRHLNYHISFDMWLEIQRRYYSTQEIVNQIPPRQYRVIFAESEIEWPDVAAGRKALYERLPEPKQELLLQGSTHYLNSFLLRGLVVADTRVTRQLMRSMQEALREPLPETQVAQLSAEAIAR